MGPAEVLKERKRMVEERQRLHPAFWEALVKDTHAVSFHRGEYFESADASAWYIVYRALRLMWVSDAFFAQALYRARMHLRARRVPLIPRILHKISMMVSQVAIDEMVVIQPGVNIAHGQVVIGGLSEIGPGCVISPWVSIGLQAGNLKGPTIGHNVFIGSGAKLLGEFTVGDGAVIGSQAMVNRDVPAGATVGGIPAKVIGNS